MLNSHAQLSMNKCNRNRNRNHNLKTSKVLLKSQAHQGTSLFTSAVTNQRGVSKGGSREAQVRIPHYQENTHRLNTCRLNTRRLKTRRLNTCRLNTCRLNTLIHIDLIHVDLKHVDLIHVDL